ncbi:MAG: hypothetical protein JXA54_13870 [Candidatus Heimdallarchaeota archaeon]|nr:hypothetical protein [Candidatus Heimdallarchaeota archaeon]
MKAAKRINDKEIHPNLNKRFRKIDDPNYSFFNEEFKRYTFMKRILIGFLAVGTPLFALGLTLLILGNIFGIIPITFGGLAVMMLIYLPIHIIDHRKFKFILELKNSKNNGALLQTARKYSISNSFLEQERARLATYLLVDLKSKEIAFILKERLSQRKPLNVKELLRVFYLLAIKLGYSNHIELFYDLERDANLERQKEFSGEDRKEIVVPITKIYYLEGIPEKARCMVSGLQLDFFADEIVVCPYCSAWAKKDLLSSWLNEKNSCPVCQRELDIEDCPLVQIASVKK